MAQIKNRTQERISKSRAAKASLLTFLSVLAFLVWCYHLYWAVGALYENRYGGIFNNLMLIVGGFILEVYVTAKALLFLESKILTTDIDADHKKYL